MAFNKKIWKDRVSEQPQRRILTNVDSNEEMTVDVTRFEGIVVQEGDAFSAQNMNDLETRIKNSFDSNEATINTVNTKANTNAANITSLQSSVTSVSNRVTTNTNNISSLSSRMTTVEGKANTNANNISNLTTRMGNVETKATTNANNIASLGNSMTGKAPTNHASTTAEYGKGSTSHFGHLKISDNYTSSAGNANDGVAASSKAVFSLKQRIESSLQAINDGVIGIRNQLKANNNSFYFDYRDGKYGYNTAANRGADTFHPFKQAYELLGSADFNISIGATTQVSINLSKVPDYYYASFSRIQATAGHHSEDTRGVSIMNYSISGNTCTVTLAHDSKTDGYDLNISGTVVVYGC
jgi:hypothetical protein